MSHSQGSVADSLTGGGGGKDSGSLKGFSRRAWSRRESKPLSVTAFYAGAGETRVKGLG